MKHLSFYLLLWIAIQSLCYADVTKLPAEDRKALLDASRFHEVHATSDLPSAILALCDGGGDGKLAEPGQNWNATDVITDPALPGKRLIWAAVGGEYYVVHYERGGVAHSFHILVAKLTKNDVKPRWFGALLDTNSKTTQHFSMHCEAGSWTAVWIIRIEPHSARHAT